MTLADVRFSYPEPTGPRATRRGRRAARARRTRRWRQRCDAATAARGASRGRPADRRGGDGGAGRRDRRGQVDRGEAAGPLLRPRRAAGRGRRPRPARARPPRVPPQLGYVPQEAFLFTGTVRDNIAYGRPSAPTPRSRRRPARSVRTTSSPRCRRLPPRAGRARRIAVVGRAAAACRSPAPSWSTRRSCCSTRRPRTSTSPPRRGSPPRCSLRRDRTTIVIAHRLQTARAADRIVLLDTAASPSRHARRAARSRAATRRCGGRSRWWDSTAEPGTTCRVRAKRVQGHPKRALRGDRHRSRCS